jgi:hypothetical protein
MNYSAGNLHVSLPGLPTLGIQRGCKRSHCSGATGAGLTHSALVHSHPQMTPAQHVNKFNVDAVRKDSGVVPRWHGEVELLHRNLGQAS